MKNLLIYLLVFSLCLGSTVAAETLPTPERLRTLDAEFSHHGYAQIMEFAGQLYSEGDYENALIMYKYALSRSQKEHVTEAQIEEARFKIALSQEMIGRWEAAERAFDDFISFHPRSKSVPEASYRIGQGYFRGEKYSEAIQHFKETANAYPDSEYAIKSRYALGLSFARQGKWDVSEEELNKFVSDYGNHPYSGRALSLASLVAEGKTLPKKSPTLAGVLSIVPGLGKLYTHHYGGAAIAFLVNAGLGFVIYDSFEHERYAVAGVFSALGAATYSANILGGYRSAKRFNARQEERYADRIVSEGYIPELESSK